MAIGIEQGWDREARRSTGTHTKPVKLATRMKLNLAAKKCSFVLHARAVEPSSVLDFYDSRGVTNAVTRHV